VRCSITTLIAIAVVVGVACGSRAGNFGEMPRGTAFPSLERIPWEVDKDFREVWSVPLSDLVSERPSLGSSISRATTTPSQR
jgi:hypothetical protein